MGRFGWAWQQEDEGVLEMSGLLEGEQVSEVRSGGDVARDWLADEDTKRRLKACIETTMQKLKRDPELLVPRGEPDRRDGFSRWLSFWQERLGPGIQEEFDRQFPELQGRLAPQHINDVVTELVWPTVQEFLVSFAVLGVSRSWVSRKLGNAIILCDPQHNGNGWIVPLRIKDRPGTIGSVVLDDDGNIDQERTVSRDQVLAQVRLCA